MKQRQKIIAFHLLNDRSGSPKVLAQLIKSWSNEYDVNLYTSLHQEGFLSNLNGVTYHKGWYKFKKNPWARLVYFCLSQLLLFFKMYPKIKKDDIVYVNTILPFGAALLGKVKSCRVIYHIHESTVNPPILKWFLFKVANLTASDVINVSKYVEDSHSLNNPKNHLVYNAIENDFLNQVQSEEMNQKERKKVLMICSLKAYKGVFEFVALAELNPNHDFKLVVNATLDEVNFFFKETVIPDNLSLFPSQKNVHPFYAWADVILNLSRPDGWIETFGLTIIEGMAYKLPAIVPPVGGIMEVIENGKTGYAVDSRNIQELNKSLNEILENQETYDSFSNQAFKRLELFKEENMTSQIKKIINSN